MEYTLHYAPDNASLIVRLALEELGQPYRTRLVDRSRDMQRSAEYLALNPAGLIPALETPDGVLFETGAILLWLADRHGGAAGTDSAPNRLAPAPDDPARGDLLKWLFFISNSFHADLRALFYPVHYAGPDAAAQAALRGHVQTRLMRHLQTLDRAASDWPNATAGNDPAPEVSVLELYLCPLLRWCALYPLGGTGWFDLQATRTLAAMAARVEQRASVRRAQSAEGLGPTPFTRPRPATPPEGSAT